jgi:hypothetical protein
LAAIHSKYAFASFHVGCMCIAPKWRETEWLRWAEKRTYWNGSVLSDTGVYITLAHGLLQTSSSTYVQNVILRMTTWTALATLKLLERYQRMTHFLSLQYNYYVWWLQSDLLIW